MFGDVEKNIKELQVKTNDEYGMQEYIGTILNEIRSMECIINNKIAIMVYDVGQATFFLKQAEVFYKDLEVE